MKHLPTHNILKSIRMFANAANDYSDRCIDVLDAKKERCDDLVAYSVLFFFQAADGIRYTSVTGVQTCALPIFDAHHRRRFSHLRGAAGGTVPDSRSAVRPHSIARVWRRESGIASGGNPLCLARPRAPGRSEERRVGKEGKSRARERHTYNQEEA